MRLARTTLFLSTELLDGIDRFVADHSGSTRSSVAEEALRRWLAARQKAEVARYYKALSSEEVAEDRNWAAAGTLGWPSDSPEDRPRQLRG
jgi:metal-responsive CopG/Arc/MetJ family transcriptional regulator